MGGSMFSEDKISSAGTKWTETRIRKEPGQE